MTGTTATMPRKPKTQSEPTPPGKASVKISTALHRKASTVAAYHGEQLSDFLEKHLGPIVEKLFAQMGREIHEGDD